MSSKISSPLGVDHKTYCKTLEGDVRALAWKRFTDGFWSSDALGAGAKGEFLFRRGFLRDKWVAYDLGNNDAELYLSDFQAAQINNANGIYANVLQDRMLLNHTLAGYCAVPKIHALRGLDAEEVSLSGEWAAHRETGDGPDMDILIQPLLAMIRGRAETARLSGGMFEGFDKSGDMRLLSNITRDWSRAAWVPYLFTDNPVRGSFLTDLYPGARNSLSVILTRDLDSWDPVLTTATMLIGSRVSQGGVEIQRGGLSAPVDVATGRIGRAATLNERGGVTRHDTHPDTNAPISGQQVPGWDAIHATLLRIMDECSYMRVAMLDFTLLEDGSLGLIGPARQDLTPVQVHGPLLEDPVFAETMRRLTL